MVLICSAFSVKREARAIHRERAAQECRSYLSNLAVIDAHLEEVRSDVAADRDHMRGPARAPALPDPASMPPSSPKGTIDRNASSLLPPFRPYPPFFAAQRKNE